MHSMSQALVSLHRGELVESVHRGHVAVADVSGKLLRWAGDPQVVTYFRSSAKPIQVLPIIASGAVDRYGITQAELAVMAASHRGEDIHVEAVASILGKIGLTESALMCGTHAPSCVWPPERASARSGQAAHRIRSGIPFSPIFNNCSGKHAGMLMYAMDRGYSSDDYISPDSRVQQDMWQAVSDVAGLPREEVVRGIDGCGVVVFGMPLSGMARAYARMSSPESLPAEFTEPARRIVRAMTDHPEMVGGSGDFGTNLMLAARGALFCKGGAEGLFCLGIPGKGLGVAIKIEDGGARAIPSTVMEILRVLGAITPEMAGVRELAIERPVRNCRGEVVGYMRPCFELEEPLKPFDRARAGQV